MRAIGVASSPPVLSSRPIVIGAMPATKARTPRCSRRLLPQRDATSASVVLGISMPTSATAAPARPATA